MRGWVEPSFEASVTPWPQVFCGYPGSIILGNADFREGFPVQ